MKTHQICPKCGSQRLLLVHDVAFAPDEAGGDEPGTPRFEAYVCEQCQYAELYSIRPLIADGRRVTGLGESEPDFYEDWSASNNLGADDPFGAEWAGDEAEITEVSRIEKKGEGSSGARVVLIGLGSTPAEVFSVLHKTLGLKLPSEKWLADALPYVVLDALSAEAAKGLQKMLADAGGQAEIHSRETSPDPVSD